MVKLKPIYVIIQMTETIPGLEPLEKPKQKMTVLTLGGGMMGCDSRTLIVTRGYCSTTRGEKLCYSKPRGRKIFSYEGILQNAIMLRGHITDEDLEVFEGDIRVDSGRGYTTRNMMLDGTGGKFADAAGDKGVTLIESLKKLMVLHTLTPSANIKLLTAQMEEGTDKRGIACPDFKRRLLDALGEPVSMEPAPPAEPQRKSLFTPKMIEKLQAGVRNDPPAPLFKVFSPEGAATWLVCSLEEDGDTLWVIADLGMGCVEYGTASLKEFELMRTPTLKLPMERDIHWEAPKMSFAEIIRCDSLREVK